MAAYVKISMRVYKGTIKIREFNKIARYARYKSLI